MPGILFGTSRPVSFDIFYDVVTHVMVLQENFRPDSHGSDSSPGKACQPLCIRFLLSSVQLQLDGISASGTKADHIENGLSVSSLFAAADRDLSGAGNAFLYELPGEAGIQSAFIMDFKGNDLHF